MNDQQQQIIQELLAANYTLLTMGGEQNDEIMLGLWSIYNRAATEIKQQFEKTETKSAKALTVGLTETQDKPGPSQGVVDHSQ